MMNRKELNVEEMDQINGGRRRPRLVESFEETAQIKTTSVNQASEDTSGIPVGSLYR